MAISKSVGYKPRLVMTVHGIRTRGVWQKEVPPVFGATVERIESFDYGRYGLLNFTVPFVNRRMIDKFYRWYGERVAACPRVNLREFDKRPSCIAHSFGTWIVANAMLKYADVKFDKLIFSGSVLPEDFDWDCLIARDQVGSVHNECGGRDFWPAVASMLVGGTGKAGSKGFGRHDSVVTDFVQPEVGHSDVLVRQHMSMVWKPFLLTQPSPLYALVGRSVPSSGFQFGALLAGCRTIDHQIYGSMPFHQPFPPGLSTTWIKINPDIYTFLIDKGTGSPAGYVNAMPVTDEAYEKLRNGLLRDRDVTANDIEPFLDNKRLKMYLMSVAILEEYRIYGQGLYDRGFIQLFAATLEKLIHYARTKGIEICHFLAVTWTPEGRKLCQSLGMVKVGVDPEGHDIYELEIAPLVQGKARPARSLNRLINAYRDN